MEFPRKPLFRHFVLMAISFLSNLNMFDSGAFLEKNVYIVTCKIHPPHGFWVFQETSRNKSFEVDTTFSNFVFFSQFTSYCSS